MIVGCIDVGNRPQDGPFRPPQGKCGVTLQMSFGHIRSLTFCIFPLFLCAVDDEASKQSGSGHYCKHRHAIESRRLHGFAG